MGSYSITLSLACALFVAAGSAVAVSGQGALAEEEAVLPSVAVQPPVISSDRLARHVEILASDAFKGRAAGGPAERKTTDYIINALKKAGLQPAVPVTRGVQWTQDVPLIRRAGEWGRLGIKIAGERTRYIIGETIALVGDKAHIDTGDLPVIFIGYGITDPRTGRDDLKSVDLEGALVLRLNGQPPEYAKTAFVAPGWAERRAALLEKGAVAELIIYPAEKDRFVALRSSVMQGAVQLEAASHLDVMGFIHEPEVESIFERTGRSFADVKRAADALDFTARPMDWQGVVAVRSKITRFKSANVLGLLPGSKKDEDRKHTVITAHWDGYGVCAPASRTDRICNGAVDNASGVAGLIEAAHALATGPALQNDVLFIATTAEEHGLLGAEHYVSQPVLPLDSAMAALNLDTIALRGKGSAVTILGQGLTSLDPLVEKLAREQGRAIAHDPSVQQFYTRSDHYAFVKKGVPAIMAMGFFSREKAENDPYDQYFSELYHQPGDETSAIASFDGAAEDSALLVGLVREIDALKTPPSWLRKVD